MMTAAGPDIETLYRYAMGPEYRMAISQAAQAINSAGGRKLAVLSAPVFATELYKRCPAAIEIAGSKNLERVEELIGRSQGWAWGDVSPAALDCLDAAAYPAILWAEPEAKEAGSTARRLHAAAAPGALLVVITSNGVRRFLAEWAAGTGIFSTSPVPSRRVINVLSAAGWQVIALTGFHGPRSIFYGGLYRLAMLLRRPDWADRVLFALRSVYQERGGLAHLAPLVMIHARRVP